MLFWPNRRLVAALTITGSLAVTSIAAAQDFEPGGDPEPKPQPGCKIKRIDYGDMPKFGDVDVRLDQWTWDCPSDHPKLTNARARRVTRRQMPNVAHKTGGYDYGVSSCRRKSRTGFGCVAYFDAVPHIRCSRKYRVYRDEWDEVRALYRAGTTHCRTSTEAEY